MNDLSNLVSAVDRMIAVHGDRVAVVDVDGTATTYARLDELADSFAAWLEKIGVGAGQRVGVCRSKSVETVAAFMGIMRRGAAYVPVDPMSPAKRNQLIFDACEVSAVLFDDAARKRMAGEMSVPTLVGSPPRGCATVVSIPAPEDLAYILYTSGSTGHPKGVCLTHRNAMSFVDWCRETFDAGPSDRCSSHAPFHFDLSILDLWMSLSSGGSVVLVGESLAKDPRSLPGFIAERGITNWYSVPSILGLMAEHGHLDEHDHSSLKVVCFAGEVFPVPALRKLRESWPEPRFFNLYGPTETNVCTAYEIAGPVDPQRTEPYPIGHPCSHCRIRLIDDDGRDVPAGTVGRIMCAGDSVMDGYWGTSPDDISAFVTIDDERWYDTGDLGLAGEDGSIIFHGRRDRMVKRHGYRIELGEVEAGLAGMASVHECAVWANTGTDGGVRIMAAVAPREGCTLSIISLRAHCGANLPPYMAPDVFTILDALPRTTTGKIDYSTLGLE